MKSEVKFLWNRFTMREALLLGFCATFIVLTKATLRMKLGISGHSMFFLLFFLLLARGLVQKTGAATLVGLLAGCMSLALGMGGKGPIKILNFLLPAIVVDGATLFVPKLPFIYPACILVAGIAAASKGVHSAALEYLAGAPAKIIMQKAALEGMFGAFFGMLGALPVPAVLRKLQTNKLISAPGDKETPD
jgi:hypothetical protein